MRNLQKTADFKNCKILNLPRLFLQYQGSDKQLAYERQRQICGA